jgi:hypothetical protein
MRRRQLLLVGLAALVAAGAFVLRPRQERITRENFARLKEGMTYTEMEAPAAGCFHIHDAGGPRSP